MNQVRGFHFMLGVFRNQQKDPYCGACSAFANTLKAVQADLGAFKVEHAAAIALLPPPFAAFWGETCAGLDEICAPPSSSGQKKAGNCKLPQGICFIKASFALTKTI